MLPYVYFLERICNSSKRPLVGPPWWNIYKNSVEFCVLHQYTLVFRCINIEFCTMKLLCILMVVIVWQDFRVESKISSILPGGCVPGETCWCKEDDHCPKPLQCCLYNGDIYGQCQKECPCKCREDSDCQQGTKCCDGQCKPPSECKYSNPPTSQCLKITQNVTFEFWHFPQFFFLLKITCLADLCKILSKSI